MEDLLGIGLRIWILYLYTLAILRLSGKRSIGELSPLDFVVSLIIGDMFDDVIWAEVPLSQGLVGITTIIFLHALVAFITYKSDRLHDLVSSRKTQVIRQGKLLREGLQKERTREEQVMFELRLQMVDELEEIREANWEPAGQISVLKREAAKTAQKKDLPLLKELV